MRNCNYIAAILRFIVTDLNLGLEFSLWEFFIQDNCEYFQYLTLI